jgi:NADPH-dependent curcumin reductase CurA
VINFTLIEAPVPERTDGNVLIENHFFSVEPGDLRLAGA